jgi:hypothetical protein
VPPPFERRTVRVGMMLLGMSISVPVFYSPTASGFSVVWIPCRRAYYERPSLGVTA